MNIILLDDEFYRNSSEANQYLDRLLDAIGKFFEAEIVFFEPFYSQPKSFHLDFYSQLINKKILKTHKSKKYDLNKLKEVKEDIFDDKLPFSQLLIDKINYILLENPEDKIIVPLVYNIQNRKVAEKKYEDKLFIIGNFDEEVESNIADWIEANEVIHMSMPTIDNIFPAHELCGGFDKWRSNILQPNYDGDKISDISAIGKEVAKRNNYKYNVYLTKNNKLNASKDKNRYSPKRQVFVNDEKSVYLSTDFENGGFEVYDKNKVHQGQYKFNGNFEKKADGKGHKLY